MEEEVNNMSFLHAGEVEEARVEVQKELATEFKELQDQISCFKTIVDKFIEESEERTRAENEFIISTMHKGAEKV